jgi:chemosensory pili system protein ChpA (sensor histidine kinase/response regulator)
VTETGVEEAGEETGVEEAVEAEAVEAEAVEAEAVEAEAAEVEEVVRHRLPAKAESARRVTETGVERTIGTEAEKKVGSKKASAHVVKEVAEGVRGVVEEIKAIKKREKRCANTNLVRLL